MKKFFILSLLLTLNFELQTLNSFAQECGIIYVTPSGVSSGLPAGTRGIPANLIYGLSLVTPTDNIVWLSDGVYNISNTLSIPDGVTIEGTFDPVTWIKTNANTSVIARDASNPDIVNLALIGLMCNGISNFRLQDLTITVADAPGNQISVYGIYLNTCSNYNITRCEVNVGAGSPGVNGNLGTNGTTGGNGSAGSQGNCNNQTVVPGGPGGTGAGGNDGGNGAIGGDWNGSAGGSPGLPGGCGGAGGASGSGPDDCFFCSPSCSDVIPGSPGGAGGSGTAGSTGALGSPGSVVGGYFAPGGAGGSGTDGANGCGGGGGGGGGGRQQGGADDRGGSGGGGGGGGAGGFGGTGAIGGGSSYAIFLFNNGPNGVIQDCDLNPGAAGSGGAGGAGGIGGSGGAGGAGGAPNCCSSSYGGAGGSGGSGGNGGNGGNGATGESVALSENGGISVSNLGITSVPGNPPIIAVLNYGCVNAEVIFYDGPSVYITNFGVGATPATATGVGPHSVIYSSLGRKTIITSDGTIFTDYLGIFNNGPSLPSIISSDTVTLGCPASFSTSLTGTYYEWIFGNVASPDTIAGASFQTVDSIYFNTLGTYTVELWVTDTCCGRVRDTITVTVDSSLLNVSLTASDDTICVGDPITFIAGGSYISYEFFINDSSVQNDPSNTFITTGLQPGDTIVVVAFAGICYTNPSAILTPVVIPIPPVTITSSDPDSTICQGDSVTFTALPATYANYEFFIGIISVQSGSSNIFVTTNLANGDSITVVSYLGCPGPPSNTIVFTVNPLPVITLTSSDPDTTICDGDTVTFIASPAGFSDYEFFVNGISAQSGASNTGTTPLLSDGDSIVVIATNSFGCVGPPSNYLVFTVNPIPSVSLSLTSLDDTICLYETFVITASPAGYDNYTFLDGSDTLQSDVDNFYSSSGLLAGTHNITVVATNLGCSSPVSNIISVTVLSGPSVTLTSSNDTICDGDSIVFTSLPSGFVNYEFFIGSNSVQSGPGNTFITTGLADGDSVTVIAIDLGCPGPVSNVIVTTVNPLPIITLTSSDPDTIICDGDIVTFTASLSGFGNYEFFINGISVQSGALETYVSSSLINGDSITVIATSSEGCLGPVSNTLVFTVNPIPSVIVASPADSICLGDIVSFIASPAGYDNYVFINGTDTVQNGAGNVYSTTGLDSINNITVIVTDLGCSSPVSNDTSVVVIYGPSVILTSSDPDSTICAGDNVIFTGSPSGYANYEFFIGTTSVQNGSVNTYTTTGLTDADTITVVVTDLGCPGPSSNAIVFTVNPIPVVSLISSADTVCLNDNISFAASPSGFDNYDFYDGVTLVQSGPDSIYITDSLQFVNSITVVATDLGCTSDTSNTVSVTVLSLPIAAFDWECVTDPFETQFSAENSIAGVGNIVSWNWDFGDGNTSTDQYPSHAFSDTGEFAVSLTVTTDKGCSNDTTNTVQAPPMAEFGLAPTVTTISTPLIIFTDASSNDVISWQWDFGDPDSDSNFSAIQDPTHTYGSELVDTGVYYILLTVENADGCRDTITHSVWIQGEYFIFTPNAFTPDNQDGDNDVFIPIGIGIENDFQMFIYDRWGNLIYETDDVDKPWDGRANGGREIAQQDVYVWVVHTRDNLRKKHRYIGHVTLIR